MKHLFKLISIFFLGAILLCQITFACSLVMAPIKRFEPEEYVFTGQVVGIVGPFESKSFRQQAWGLQIKIQEKVNLPETPTGDFELIPFELWADCSANGRKSEDLLKNYPVGSKVKVIARAAQLVPRVNGVNLRLEILPGTWGDISRNYYEDGRQMADAQSIFDYKSFKRPTGNDYVESFMPFLDAKGALPDFELRKDLLRLEKAKSQQERLQIINRLLFYPAGGRGDFYGIAEHYLRDAKLVKALDRQREEHLKKNQN
jgi:hypothetical protein